MKITFIRGTGLGGIGNDAFPGDVRDLPDAQAKQLIAQGRAVAVAGAVKAAAPAKKSSAPAAPEGGTQAGEEGQGA